MDSVAELEVLIDEVIGGNDSKLKTLQMKLDTFWNSITQEKIDQKGNEKLRPFMDTYHLINKKKTITPVDRALLTHYLSKKSTEFLHYSYSGKITIEQLKQFSQRVHSEQKLFGKKAVQEFMAFIGWVLAFDSLWDDIKIENDRGTLQLSLTLNNNESPEMKLLIAGYASPESTAFVKHISSIFEH